MSRCRNTCRLCENLILSESVTFANGELTITIPTGAYANHHRYCIVIAQALPNTTTINAPVMISIGGNPVLYPLVNKCCKPVLAKQLRARCRYATRVETTTDSGVFKLLADMPCCTDNLKSINGDGTPVANA